MGLREYRRKRRFDRTPEPAGAKASRVGDSFCVQKHHASRLHYDFRLEMEGVLRSWAVPKGPSLDPAEKRFAAHVEDHPVEYGGFEGIIPKGQYGGGTVVLWDRGTWEPDGDPVAAYRAGKIKFHLDGEKLKGGWTLVRMGGARNASGKDWLLIKEKDDEARPGRGSSLVDDRPESVLTGRTAEEIAAAKDRVWQSKPRRGAREPKVRPGRVRRVATANVDPAEIEGARRSPLPAHVEPELATLVDEAPGGDDWLHEIKFDGYRILCRVEKGRARLESRNAKDWTARFPTVAAAAAALPVRDALLDGEAVIVEENGTTSFQALQNALSEGHSDCVVYFAFDLVHLDGWDLRGAPLVERKRALAALLASAPADGPLRYSDHVLGRGGEFFDQACRLAVEGAVCKRAASRYVAGRGRDWLKVKCLKGQEVVIVGFTEPAGARTGLGALLVGVHDKGGELRFAGKVGTGFTQASLESLRAKLGRIEVDDPPVANPPRGANARGVHWVEPKLVAEVAFTEWTRDGSLRHPSFQGLRADKPAREIVRERTQQVPKATGLRAVRRSAAARLRSSRTASPSEVAGVVLTHPDRVLYPEQGLTKAEIARYYDRVAEWMLPHVAGRPLTLVRCPQGEGSTCFYQKHATGSVPPAIRPIPLRDSGGVAQYMEIDSAEGLVSLVQMGVLEIHVWGSRTADVEHPDRVIFDLDPDPSVAWGDVVKGALEVRERLTDLGLESFVKTTGGKGLHVVAPIRGSTSWDEAKAFARAVADAIVADSPSRYTANMSKAKRVGRIFIDYLRNGRGATAVAPYSTRARAGAPVATPIDWKELTARLRPAAFDVRSVPARKARLASDPWSGMDGVRQSITAAIVRRVGLG